MKEYGPLNRQKLLSFINKDHASQVILPVASIRLRQRWVQPCLTWMMQYHHRGNDDNSIMMIRFVNHWWQTMHCSVKQRMSKRSKERSDNNSTVQCDKRSGYKQQGHRTSQQLPWIRRPLLKLVVLLLLSSSLLVVSFRTTRSSSHQQSLRHPASRSTTFTKLIKEP